ncbi:MAG TPA: molybdenum cofactor biosynthesis protein MoaE [Polyangiaceae bacterium]|nr:molybdenum cofactor biosynthesis protein MoaE [Polyangiaceae bacterium]
MTSTAPPDACSLVAIRAEPISVQEALDAVGGEEMGGIAVFVGTVRSENQGRAVTLLEYHAYQAMAERQMRKIMLGIARDNASLRLAALHRVGALAVGDIAVVCAAATPHRGEAFAACRRLIDEIKADVPIWKREHGPSGPYWVGWEDARCHGEHGEHAPHDHTREHSH